MIMFTQPCFIRKYSEELCKKLEYLGLELINSGGTTLDCHNYDGKGHHKMIEEGRAIITYQSSHYGVIYDIDDVTKKGRVDCGTNEQLFLAISALRDDTDKNQWFTNGDDWILCDFLHLSEHFYFYKIDKIDLDIDSMHKATVEELIEHFKDK